MDETAGEESPIGRVLDDRYRLESLLGRGGMGAVYEATQLSMDRRVAVKLMRSDVASDSAQVKRFLREVQAASRVSHGNLVTLYDFAQSGDGTLYVVMELIDGESLSAVLTRTGALSPDMATAICQGVASGLAAAHAVGVVHRDLKPENVMLMAGADPLDPAAVKIVDFGIAKLDTGLDQTRLTRTGYAVGTPAYMAPEQASGAAAHTPATDLYSLGCVLFECLAGRPPFTDNSVLRLMEAQCLQTPPDVDAVRAVAPPAGPELSALVSELMQKRPADRPQSAADVSRRLAGMRGVDRAVSATDDTADAA